MKTHFADDDTLAHIQKLERDNKELREALEQILRYCGSDTDPAIKSVASRAILEKTQ